jgi:DNA repair exonuclease SbcCD ATPase subunit
MSVTKQLNKLDERIAAAEREVRELGQREREAQAELAAARDALASHFEQEAADPTPSKLHNNLTAADKVEQPWAERKQGLARRLAKLRQERGQFISDNAASLIEAQREDAHRVTDQVVGLLEGIERVERDYHVQAQRCVDLIQPVDGVQATDVPLVDLTSLKSEAARILERGVPAPVPRQFTPDQDADPTIRSAA